MRLRLSILLPILLGCVIASTGCGSKQLEHSNLTKIGADEGAKNEARDALATPMPTHIPISDNAPRVGDCILQGSPEWVESVTSALSLLESKRPDVFSRIQKHVGIIYEGNDDYGSYTSIRPEFWRFPVITLAPQDATTPTLCAVSLAHESYHAYLHDFRFDIPETNFEFSHKLNAAEELVCIRHQIEVGLDLGVDEYLIEYWKSLDGTHYIESKKKWQRLAEAEARETSAQLDTTE